MFTRNYRLFDIATQQHSLLHILMRARLFLRHFLSRDVIFSPAVTRMRISLLFVYSRACTTLTSLCLREYFNFYTVLYRETHRNSFGCRRRLVTPISVLGRVSIPSNLRYAPVVLQLIKANF